MSKKIKIPLDNMRYALHDLFHEHLDEIYEYRKMRRSRGSRYDWAEDEEVQWLMQQGVIFPGMEDDMANFYDDFDYDEEDDADTIWPPTSSSFSGIGASSKKKKHSLDPYGDYWNMVEQLEKKQKGKKKHKRGSRGKAKVIDITTPYSGMEDDPREVDEFESSGIEDGKEIWFYPDYTDKSNRLEFNTLSDFSDFCADQGYHVEADVGMAIAYRRISHTCLDPELRDEGIMKIIAEDSYADMRYAVTPVQELSQ